MLRIPLQKFQIIAFIFLPLAWIARNTFFLRQREAHLYSSIDQAAIAQIIIVLMTALVILTARPLSFWHDLKGTSGRWWIMFYLFGILSIFWSDNPSYSGYRALEYLILSIALMYVILNSADENTAERNVLLMSWAVLACEVLSKSSILNLFSVSGIRSNTFGACAVMIACYSWGKLLSENQERKKTLIINGIMSTFLVLYSLSLASWWALLIGMAFASIFSRQKMLFLMLSCLLITSFAYLDQDIIDQFIYREKLGMTFDEALTGRKMLWEDYWFSFQEKPLLGFGYAMMSRAVGQIYTTNTHNFIFAIAGGVGVIGFVIFLGYFLKLVGEFITNLRFKVMSAVGLFAAIIAGFVNGMSLSFISESYFTPSQVFICFISLHLYHYIAITNEYKCTPDGMKVYLPEQGIYGDSDYDREHGQEGIERTHDDFDRHIKMNGDQF